MKQKIKVVAGILIMPIFSFIFMLDRLVLFFLPWKAMKNLQGWIFKPMEVVHSLYRIFFALALFGMYKMIW